MEAPNKNLIICPECPITWEIHISVFSDCIQDTSCCVLFVRFGWGFFWCLVYFWVECALKLFAGIEMRYWMCVYHKERCIFKAFLFYCSDFQRQPEGRQDFIGVPKLGISWTERKICVNPTIFMSSCPKYCSQSLPYSTYALQVTFKIIKIWNLAEAFSCAFL